MIPARTLRSLTLLAVLCSGAAFTQQTAKALSNADVIRMMQAGLSDDLIVSAIQANPTQLDVSVDGLLALKKAGASDKVIAAVLASHKASGGSAALSAPTAPANPQAAAMAPQPMAMMAGPMQMGAQAQAMLASMGMGGMMGMSPASSPSAQMPHVKLLVDQQRLELPFSTAQVAQTKLKGGGGGGASMLQSLATQALTFAAISAGPGALMAAPMMSMAGGMLPGMHHSMPSMTYVWALPGKRSSTLAAGAQPKFDITYADIVGIDPDDYEPALVNLVQTKDNWRLVGASRIKMNQMTMGYPQGAIAEKRLPVRIQKIASGNVQIEPTQPLPSGEYAVVLHPLHKKHKGSLGGGSEAQVFYSVWDFSVPGQPDVVPQKKK